MESASKRLYAPRASFTQIEVAMGTYRGREHTSPNLPLPVSNGVLLRVVVLSLAVKS